MNQAGSQSGDSVIAVDVFGADMKLCTLADCGPSMPEAEQVESVRLGLTQRYGERVRVEYHSLRDPAVEAAYAELLGQALRLHVPLPIVVVNGAIIQGGGIDYRAIVNAIDLQSE